MNSLFAWLSRAMGDGENPSALRLVMVPSVLLVVATACAVFAVAAWRGTPIPDVPIGTSAFFLSILGTVLGAKVWQAHAENRTPPTGGTSS